MKIFIVRHGVTEININNIIPSDENYPITKHGAIQAKETGKVLSKYGTFDLIICSPFFRTKQTAEIINKELNVKKIIYNDLIIERSAESLRIFANMKAPSASDVLNNKELLDKASTTCNIKEIIKYNELEKLEKETTDPFELYEITKNKNITGGKMLKDESPKKVYKDDMNFLKYLKTLKYKRILIVSHGGTITRLLQIITNTMNTEIKFIPGPNTLILDTNDKETGKPKLRKIINEDYKYYCISNCSITGLIYDENQFRMIIPPNILHLKKYLLKEPTSYPKIK